MTDLNIVKYMDEHYVKTGEVEIKDIREHGEYTVSMPVYNDSGVFAKRAVAVFHLDFTCEGNDIVLHHVPKHLLSDKDCVKIKKAIADFFHEKELPSQILCEALLHRQQNPYEKQNLYLGWRKPDDTLFLVGMESSQVHYILLYEYDTYFKDYNVKLFDINSHTEHLRGPQHFDPIEELIKKVSKYDYLGSWVDPEFFMESHDGKVAACGRWELAKAHICNEPIKDSLDSKLASARVQYEQMIDEQDLDKYADAVLER